VRDDKPFGGPAPPAALFYYSPDRGGEHPEKHLADYRGIMQADAYAGFNGLYVAGRKPGPIIEAACWAHGRRKLYELADLQKAPIAIEAVKRIDALFAIEREINGLAPDLLLTWPLQKHTSDRLSIPAARRLLSDLTRTAERGLTPLA
jgi:transposase